MFKNSTVNVLQDRRLMNGEQTKQEKENNNFVHKTRQKTKLSRWYGDGNDENNDDSMNNEKINCLWL